MQPLRIALVPLFVVMTAATACAAPASETDAARAARYTVALEKDPLGNKAPDQRQWLLLWVTETPDFNVTACDVLGEGQKVGAPYSAELLAQQIFGNVAYQIANPRGGRDEITLQMAGVESTLRAYKAILARDPTARVPYLDSLLEKQRSGELKQFMKPIIVQRCLTADVETQDA